MITNKKRDVLHTFLALKRCEIIIGESMGTTALFGNHIGYNLCYEFEKGIFQIRMGDKVIPYQDKLDELTEKKESKFFDAQGNEQTSVQHPTKIQRYAFFLNECIYAFENEIEVNILSIPIEKSQVEYLQNIVIWIDRQIEINKTFLKSHDPVQLEEQSLIDEIYCFEYQNLYLGIFIQKLKSEYWDYLQIKDVLLMEKNETPSILLNYKPDQQKHIIELLYRELYPTCISVSVPDFEAHFGIGSRPFQKTKWNKSEPLIVLLFEELKRAGVISNSDIFKLIELHFLNKRGENFKNKQLSTVSQKLCHSKTRDIDFITAIISKVEKLVLTF